MASRRLRLTSIAGLTDEQITQICGTVGAVLNFRLIYDSETGRPKGYGFAEFADAETAASAVRNLDKYSIGGRELRVDFSHVDSKEDAAPPHSYGQQQQAPAGGPTAGGPNGQSAGGGGGGAATAGANPLGPLPVGV